MLEDIIIVAVIFAEVLLFAIILYALKEADDRIEEELKRLERQLEELEERCNRLEEHCNRLKEEIKSLDEFIRQYVKDMLEKIEEKTRAI